MRHTTGSRVSHLGRPRVYPAAVMATAAASGTCGAGPHDVHPAMGGRRVTRSRRRRAATRPARSGIRTRHRSSPRRAAVRPCAGVSRRPWQPRSRRCATGLRVGASASMHDERPSVRSPRPGRTHASTRSIYRRSAATDCEGAPWAERRDWSRGSGRRPRRDRARRDGHLRRGGRTASPTFGFVLTSVLWIVGVSRCLVANGPWAASVCLGASSSCSTPCSARSTTRRRSRGRTRMRGARGPCDAGRPGPARGTSRRRCRRLVRRLSSLTPRP